jgi:hypothetical protein
MVYFILSSFPRVGRAGCRFSSAEAVFIINNREITVKFLGRMSKKIRVRGSRGFLWEFSGGGLAKSAVLDNNDII